MKQIEDRGAGDESCSPSFEEVPPAVEELDRSLLFFLSCKDNLFRLTPFWEGKIPVPFGFLPILGSRSTSIVFCFQNRPAIRP